MEEYPQLFLQPINELLQIKCLPVLSLSLFQYISRTPCLLPPTSPFPRKSHNREYIDTQRNTLQLQVSRNPSPEHFSKRCSILLFIERVFLEIKNRITRVLPAPPFPALKQPLENVNRTNLHTCQKSRVSASECCWETEGHRDGLPIPSRVSALWLL